MRLRPGSAAWLLRHEARLMLRGRIHGGVLITIGALVGLVLHAAAWPLLHLWRGGLAPAAMVVLGTAMLLVVSLMVAQAIALSVDALFVRGDLDLLLASPIAPRTVFLVRSLGIAFAAIVAYGFFVTPFANMGLFTHHAGLIAIYPALVALALLTTALGMAATLALVRWLGAERAWWRRCSARSSEQACSSRRRRRTCSAGAAARTSARFSCAGRTTANRLPLRDSCGGPCVR